MLEINLKAHGKINIGLDVVGKRPNGYHDVKMVMQMVTLHDNLILKKSDTNKITMETNLKWLPTNEKNLVYRAVQKMKEEYNISIGIHVILEKRIPVAAGMAGGSTDCASALIGMNKLFDLGLTLDELERVGVTLGADVPYCIRGGTALSEGIGEILTPLPSLPKCFIVIAKPKFSVSTKYVYENLKLDELENHPDIDGIVNAIYKQDLRGITTRLENVLESVTMKAYPVIDSIKQKLKNYGALNALMSGSGPTVFGIFDDERVAKKARDKMSKDWDVDQVFLTTLLEK